MQIIPQSKNKSLAHKEAIVAAFRHCGGCITVQSRQTDIYLKAILMSQPNGTMSAGFM